MNLRHTAQRCLKSPFKAPTYAELAQRIADDEGWIKNADGSYNAPNDVSIEKGLVHDGKLQVRFRHVRGNFYCGYNNLTSLQGAPKEVGGKFYCSYNNLTSLQGAPEKVRGDFWCGGNKKKFTKEEVEAVCKVKGHLCTN